MTSVKRKYTLEFDYLSNFVIEILWVPWRRQISNGISDSVTNEESEDSAIFTLPTSSTSRQHGQTHEGSSNYLEQKFVCNLCENEKRFSNAFNRRRHYLHKHNVYLCDILDCRLTFTEKEDLDDHRSNPPHSCPICGKLFKGETGIKLARKHLNGHAESNSTMMEDTFSPLLSSTRIEDDDDCCTQPHKAHEMTLELAICAADRNALSHMALVFNFLYGPEKIYSSIEHIDNIVHYGSLYSSYCHHRRDDLTTSELFSTIILDFDTFRTTCVSVKLMEGTTVQRGTFDITSFESCFQQLCNHANGNFGIFTINQVPIAVVLTKDKFYGFNFDLEKDGSVFQLRVCMPSHPRTDCLEDFLYEYLESVGDQSVTDDSDDLLNHPFSFKILSLKSLSVDRS